MAIPTSKFKTIEVRNFIAKRYPYAEHCFAQDNREETISSLKVEKWFRGYFPAESAYNLFRQLECSVTQYVEMKK